MLELLEFIFASFWRFVGALILLGELGGLLIGVVEVARRPKSN